MKQYMLVDVMVDISNNLIDENDFRNKLAEWVKNNNWDLNGFVGEYKDEYDDFEYE